MSKPSQVAAFIGLGVMGYPMAGHLARNGFSVRVYNRTRTKAEQWLAEYGDAGLHIIADTPREAAIGADVTMLCVGNDDDVRSVVLGADGALAGLAAGTLLIDHTTASKTLAETLNAACAQANVGFLDAPVSGGQAGAENGALTVMMGGAAEHAAQAEAYIACYSKKQALLGPAGAGQLAKMVNQICIAGVVQGLAEGLHFAQQAGLDIDAVVDVISQGAAQSWQMVNRAPTMAKDEYEFGFAVDWMRKDLGIALDTGRDLNAKLPLTALVDQFYADVQAMDGGRWDTSSLLRRLRPRD